MRIQHERGGILFVRKRFSVLTVTHVTEATCHVITTTIALLPVIIIELISHSKARNASVPLGSESEATDSGSREQVCFLMEETDMSQGVCY